MIPAVYHAERRSLPGQHEQHPLAFIVKPHPMDVFHCFLPHRDIVALLPLINFAAYPHEMHPVRDIKFQVHQYMRGGKRWLSTYLRQRFLAADFFIFLRVVGLT